MNPYRDPNTGRYITKAQYVDMELLASVQRALYRESMDEFDKEFTPPSIEDLPDMLCAAPAISDEQLLIPMVSTTPILAVQLDMLKYRGNPWHRVPRSRKKQAQMMAEMLRGIDDKVS